MSTQNAPMRELAQRLLTLEAARRAPADAHAHEAMRVFEGLRSSLARFAGTEGFASLLRRALALAQAEVPALKTVKVNADGSLQGLEQAVTAVDDRGSDAAVTLAAHLLSLLVIFIGESLTLRLVRDAWPDVA